MLYASSGEQHLVAYREVNVRVEFRADFLRQIVAEGRRILSHKFCALSGKDSSKVSSKVSVKTVQSQWLRQCKVSSKGSVKSVVKSAAHTVAQISSPDRGSEREE